MKLPTIDDLLAIAHQLAKGWEPSTYPHQLAQGIIDLLDEPQPCSIEPFDILDGELAIGDTTCLEEGGRISSTDARHLARLLLRGADEAETG